MAHDDRAAGASKAVPGGDARAGVPARTVLLLSLLAILPYANALGAGFTLDDQPQIRGNPAVTDGVDVVGILASPLFPGDLYRPLTVFTFALNEASTPGLAAAFHATNLLLHAAVTLLVLAVATRLFRSATVAMGAAALFAVHPIHTEAVTSLVGRAELLAALFAFVTLLSATPSGPAVPRSARLLLPPVSIGSFCLALLSKESALAVLPLIPLFRVACRGEPLGRGMVNELRRLDWVPYALCAGIFLLLRFYVVGAVTAPLPIQPLNNPLAFVSWTVRMRSAVAVLWDYFGLLNVPFALTADYSFNQVPLVMSWTDPRFVAGLTLIGAAAVVVLRHRRPAVAFAAALPFVGLLLTSNLLFCIGTIKAERLLYFPSVGWALLVAVGFDRLLRAPRYRAIGVGMLAVMLVGFGARTWQRNWDWQDNLALYRSMARGAPDSAKSRHNLGVVYEREGAYDAAIAQYARALAVYPYPESAFGIALLCAKQGRVDDAIAWYQRALAIAPGFAKAHTNLCQLLRQHERFEAAVRACRDGLRYAPADANLLKGLGLSLVGAGDVDRGAAVLQRALVLDESDRDLRTYLAQLEPTRAPEAAPAPTGAIAPIRLPARRRPLAPLPDGENHHERE